MYICIKASVIVLGTFSPYGLAMEGTGIVRDKLLSVPYIMCNGDDCEVFQSHLKLILYCIFIKLENSFSNRIQIELAFKYNISTLICLLNLIFFPFYYCLAQ
jgi:hypothetical protein